MRTGAFTIGLGLLLSAAVTGAAQPEASFDEAPPQAPALTFRAGSWDAYTFGGAVQRLHHSGDHVAFGGLGLEYFELNDLSVNVEGLGYSFSQSGIADAQAGGMNILARWYFAHAGDLAFFVEGGAGFVLADHRLNGSDGTHFDWTPQAGLGARLRLSDTISLIGGARFLHISNAGWLHGSDRNPGFDGIGGYGGLLITF